MTRLLILAALTLPLAACGTTREERALTGGAIGAGAGAVGAAITGGSVGAGAIIGGAAGAATGALTGPETIDLNRLGND